MQLYPGESKGNLARQLTILAALVSGIVMGKSCQLPTIARKAPDGAKVDSRIKRYSRCIQNERIDNDAYYLPFVQELLYRLAEIREPVFIIDGSEVGQGCITFYLRRQQFSYERQRLLAHMKIKVERPFDFQGRSTFYYQIFKPKNAVMNFTDT